MTTPSYLDGPGCGVSRHDDDCLCDVTLPAGPAAPAGNPDLALRELVEIHGDAVLSSPAELSDTDPHALSYHDARAAAPRNRYAGADHVMALAAEGRTLAEVAVFLGEPLDQMMRALCQRDEMIPALLEAERIMRDNPDTIHWPTIAKQVGLTVDTVRPFGNRLGFQSQSQLQGSRGGKLLPPGTREAIWRMVLEEGRSYRSTAKELGLQATTVRRIARRREEELAEVGA